MPRSRKLENLSFYEWYVSRWVTSEAHLELDATGRGIYREMLDYCYIQGSVSSDIIVLAKRCACTREQLTERWETIERYFYRDGEGRLRNRHADQFRGEYEHYLKAQSEYGKAGGRPVKGSVKGTLPSAKGSGFEQERVPFPELKGTLSDGKGFSKTKETNREEIAQQDTERGMVAAAFDGWFASYPKAVRRTAAEAAWFQLVDSGEINAKTIADVIAGTERWRVSKEWAKNDGEYIPDPSTFLTGNGKHGGRLWKEHPRPVATEKPDKRSSDGVDPEAEYVIPEEWRRNANRG